MVVIRRDRYGVAANQSHLRLTEARRSPNTDRNQSRLSSRTEARWLARHSGCVGSGHRRASRPDNNVGKLLPGCLCRSRLTLPPPRVQSTTSLTELLKARLPRASPSNSENRERRWLAVDEYPLEPIEQHPATKPCCTASAAFLDALTAMPH